MEGITVYHGSKKALASTNLGFEVYSRSWRLLNNFIENDLRALSTSIFESVDSFIKSSHQSWLARRSCGRSALSSPEQIPTALLLAGVNTPDHYLIYQRIKSSVLSQRGSVAIIQPGSVTSSSRSLVASVIEQMTTHCVTFPTGAPFQDSEVVEQCERPDNFDDDSLKQFSSTTCKTYLALSEWYHTRANVLHSRSMLADCRKPLVLRRPRRSLSQPDTESIGQSRPLRSNALPRSIQTTTTAPLPRRRFTEQPGSRSRRREHASVPSATYPATECHSEVQSMMAEDKGPLVIILPQVESISAQVLQDFIELSSIYVSGQIGGVSRALPLCLILGLSTTPEIGFVARLNASTLGRLQMEYFTVPPPAVFLVSVLEKLIAFPGFHLTHPMWTYLVDSLFLCLDYSVRNFLRRVQFCMLEHCLNCPHPELLLPSRKARDYLVSLSSSELAHLVSVQFPSLTCCVSDSELSASPSTKHSSSSDRLLPLPLVDRLVEKLEAHWQLQCLASPVLRWLFDILSSISAFPIAKSVNPARVMRFIGDVIHLMKP
ncbi:unnamed protein product [Dicrocoelium dendriticum]|nr:unnamed protein product [Dicrocoelium dendriticum]